jgi:hypothetical protein
MLRVNAILDRGADFSPRLRHIPQAARTDGL